MANTVISLDKSSLDNTISFVDNAYVADNGLTKTEFRPAGNKVFFENKGFTIGWTPSSMKYVDESGMEDTIYSVQDAPLEIKGNKARFNRSMPDVDDMFIVDGDRLKHSIMVQGWQRDPAFYMFGNIDFVISGELAFDPSLSVRAMGMNLIGPFETSESIEIRNGGEVIFTLPKIVAYDSNIPDRAEVFGRYRVIANGNGTLTFDIVMDNAWMASNDRVYPVLIDPTVVVASAYDTSGNGGRKLVRLSNGWLVSAVYNSASTRIEFYKSTDNGTTWSLLCFRGGVATTHSGFAISNKGNIVYLILAVGGNTWFSNFDATTVTTAQGIEFTVNISVDIQTSNGSGVSLAINSTGTELHATWSSKNATYPNSFNIRYAKGTIDAQGVVTWGSVNQVTTSNTAGQDNTNPSIVVRSNGYPSIVSQYANGTSVYIIQTSNYNGSSWTSLNIYNGSTYSQSNPCAVVKKYGSNIGRIFVGWHGLDSTDTTKQNVRIAYSDDGGTWTVIGKITTGNTVDRKNVSFAENTTGDIYAFYEDNGNIVYQKCTNGTTTFSGLTSIATGTNVSVMEYEIADMIGFIWMDASAVKFDLISFNMAPTAPTGLTRSNFDATQAGDFTWTFSDPDSGDSQSAYQLQIIRVSDSVTVVDTGKVASTTSSHTLAASTLANNIQYQWKVATWDQSDVMGPYSSLATFYTSAKPSATITNPATDGATVPTSSLTIEWSFSDPESEGQLAYQVKLTDNADVVLWDSGKITDASARNRTIEYTLANSTNYKAKLTVWDAKDIASTEVIRTFTVSFTPPYAPVVTPTADSANGRITAAISNPAWKTTHTTPVFTGTGTGTMTDPTTTDGVTESGNWEAICTATAANGGTFDVKVSGISVGTATVGTPFTYNGVTFIINDGATDFALNDTFTFTTTAIKVQTNDLYRRKQGDTVWTRIKTGITVNGSYDDYAVASGVTYEYMVRAFGDNGTTADSAGSAGASITLTGVWLYVMDDPANTIHHFPFDGGGRNTDWQAEASFMQFAGRTRPIVEFGESEEGKFSAQLQMLSGSQDYSKLDTLVKRKETVCWRDGRGRRAFGVITALPIQDETFGYTTTVSLTEISYSEAV